MASSFPMGDASPRSSNYSESSSSSYQEELSSSMRSPDTTTGGPQRSGTTTDSGGPYLQILEEPHDKFRFRYKTEMQGTHGAILGINGQKSKNKKSFPKVKLCNYIPTPGEKDPIIRCTLYTADEDENKRVAHVHRLVQKDNGLEREDPHDVAVTAPFYTAVFKNMTILFTKKEEQEKILLMKKQNHIRQRFTTDAVPFRINLEELRTKIIAELVSMNRNVACLRFEALVDQGKGMYTLLCPPIYSRPINNMKNPQTNELRICRVDKCSGSCLGGEEVFIFVEKVVKKNIKVKFFEEGPNNEIVWSDYASFTQDDVHHQYGIAFRTPPYRDPNITNDVEVYFQLERPSDKAISDPVIFEYHPNPNRRRDQFRKRPRQDSSNNLPTMLNDFIEKPKPWNQGSQVAVADSSNVPLFEDINALCNNVGDISDLLKEITQNPMDLGEQTVEANPSLTTSDWSFEKAFGSLQSGDMETFTQFLNSGRLHEYAVLNGEEEAAQMLMDGLENATCRDLVFDCNSSGILEKSKQSSNDLRTSVPPGLISNNHEHQIKKNHLMENENSIYAEELRKSFSRAYSKSNIVEWTDMMLKNLLKVKQRNTVAEQKSLMILSEIVFSRTVEETEDSVLHVLAASKDNNKAVAQAARFISGLKSLNITDRILALTNLNQETPLHVAAARGSVEMLSLLLEAGAKVDARDHNDNTALHLVVLRGIEACHFVSPLLKKHPTLSLCNIDGYNILHLAALKNLYDVMAKLILKISFDCSEDLINQRDRKRGNTPLHIAVVNRFPSIINLLLVIKSINVDARNFDGKTPLAFVLGKHDSYSVEITDKLLKKQADPSLVELSKKHGKDEYDEDSDVELTDDDYLDESETSYAKDWGDENKLFDKETISKMCPLLDEKDDWEILCKRLNFSDTEMDLARKYWSPSLAAFKMARLYKPEITNKVVRNEVFNMGPHLYQVAQHINDMLLERQRED